MRGEIKLPIAVIPSIRPAIVPAKSSTNGIEMMARQKWLAIEFQTRTLDAPHTPNSSDPRRMRVKAPMAATNASPKLRLGLKT